MQVINKKQAFAMSVRWIFKHWKKIGVYTHYLYDTDNLSTGELYEKYGVKDQWHLINITKNPRPNSNLKGPQY